MKKSTLNITAGTDVVLNDTLTFQDEVFDPSLSVNVEANLISGLGKRSALSFEIEDTHMIIDVPWEEGRLTGCYGLEVRGVTNGRKWATYSDSLIRYTKATEDGASSVTDEGDVYDITQTVAYRYSVSPIEEITADTDGLTGTPSVSVDYNGKDIAFHFDGIKGEKGDAFKYDDFTPEELERLRGPQGPKGKDGVVLDPEAVTIFDDIDDLYGKTATEKETYIPDGNITDVLTDRDNAVKADILPYTNLTGVGGNTTLGSLSIDADTKEVVAKTGSNADKYKVSYTKGSLPKGSVLHFIGTPSTSTASRVWGWTTTNPEDYITEYGTLAGLELTNLYRCSGEATHDYRIEAPYDGAYLVWCYYSSYWSSTTFRFYLADGVKTMREDIDNIGVHKGIYPNVDLSIGDDNGYDIVTFSDGHIQTKAFDSNNLFPLAAISQFARIAVIGDSWSSGYYYTESGVLKRDIRKFSWIANLARRNGVHWYNFAVGGTTAARWLGKSEGTTQYNAETNPTGSNSPRNDSEGGLLALLNAPACDLYFVWLGANERGTEHYDIGTIEDADTPDVTRHRLVNGTTYVDEPAFPDTFYGNTALILWHIANHAPKAKIVFICGNASPSRTGTTVYDGDLSGARLAIIDAQSLPRMRPSDDWWYKTYISDKQSAGTLLGDHPDILDNSGMALAIERLFSAVADDNRDYFRTYYNADAFGISATANTDEQ